MMEENNRRILKNTIYLYLRQIIIMFLAFFSTRIVLKKLGVDDYGLYNIVGGFVALFTVFNNILASATRRFMALSIGKKDPILIKNTFSTSFVLHIIIAVLVVVILETLGIYLLNTVLNIDSDRMSAANWVFQFSVFSVFLSITQTPYVACITAREHFSVYAFMSIFDVVAKLLVLYLLVTIPGDKLIVYAALLCAVNIVSISIYRIYCMRIFPECAFSLHIDKQLFRDMLSFSGWDSLGNISSMVNAHGMSILLNLFFNTAINASRGLAETVSTTIANFVIGFVVAAEPQLAKYYAQNDMKRFERLIFNVSQYTLFLLAIIAVPVFMEIDYVLALWLDTVPDYTSSFIKITIWATIIQYSNMMVLKGIVAIGRVKQITTMTVPMYFIHLPLVWFVLWLGMSPNAVYWVAMIPYFLGLSMNLHILHKYAGFPSKQYFFQIFCKNLGVIMIACIPPYIVRSMMEDGLMRFLVVCGISVLTTLSLMWLFSLNRDVKQMIMAKLCKR